MRWKDKKSELTKQTSIKFNEHRTRDCVAVNLFRSQSFYLFLPTLPFLSCTYRWAIPVFFSLFFHLRPFNATVYLDGFSKAYLMNMDNNIYIHTLYVCAECYKWIFAYENMLTQFTQDDQMCLSKKRNEKNISPIHRLKKTSSAFGCLFVRLFLFFTVNLHFFHISFTYYNNIYLHRQKRTE